MFPSKTPQQLTLPDGTKIDLYQSYHFFKGKYYEVFINEKKQPSVQKGFFAPHTQVQLPDGKILDISTSFNQPKLSINGKNLDSVNQQFNDDKIQYFSVHFGLLGYLLGLLFVKFRKKHQIIDPKI